MLRLCRTIKPSTKHTHTHGQSFTLKLLVVVTFGILFTCIVLFLLPGFIVNMTMKINMNMHTQSLQISHYKLDMLVHTSAPTDKQTHTHSHTHIHSASLSGTWTHVD